MVDGWGFWVLLYCVFAWGYGVSYVHHADDPIKDDGLLMWLSIWFAPVWVLFGVGQRLLSPSHTDER